MSEQANTQRPARAAERPDDSESSYDISTNVVMLSETAHAEAESIRTMRTHILTRHIQKGRRGITMCAPNPKAGCSFTAVNLAVSLSQVGVSTLLIDADLRNPSIEDYIRPQSSKVTGLRQCIETHTVDPHGSIHWDILPALSVLYSGGHSENPQELLGSDTFKDLLEICLRDFDCTIVDTPPANLYADARRASSLIGYGVIVARRNVSLMSDISTLAGQMSADGVGVVGTVLNEF